MNSFGGYRILGRLGRGGMGAVYKAAMPVTGKIVALKVCEPAEMLEAVLGLDEVHRVFLREAVLMARIRHPGVAQVWDVGRVDGVPYFLMEYFCNNLGQVIGEDAVVERPSRPLGPDTALSHARQVVAGLGRLHYEGIVHRDVKPFNVMLTDDNQCRLIDFGLSKLRGDDLNSPRGMAVGSPYYTAPEQEDDPDVADARSDLFSVGVTLYRMLTGLLPETGHAPVSRLVHGLDPEWDRVVERAMHPEPDRRYQSAAELLYALDGLADHWGRVRDAACAYVEEDAGGCDVSPDIPTPRHTPVKVLRKNAREVLELDELWRPARCVANAFVLREAAATDLGPRPAQDVTDTAPEARPDEASSPEGRAATQTTATQTTATETRVAESTAANTPAAPPQTPHALLVEDRATGLVWQQDGSPYALDLKRARDYVDGLNRQGFGGYDDWRLPTVAELCTILRNPAEPGAFCLDDVFASDRPRLWSADRRSFNSAWYADATLGFVWWQDDTCQFHVRAVRHKG